MLHLLKLALLLAAPSGPQDLRFDQPVVTDTLQGVVLGELDAHGAILQARLTAPEPSAAGEIPGVSGWIAFDLWKAGAGEEAARQRLGPVQATAEADYLARVRATDLEAGSSYRWQVWHGLQPGSLLPGVSGQFRTPPGPEGGEAVRLVVANCMSRHLFLQDASAAADHELGFPGLSAIRELAPHGVIFAGDCVYYDKPQKAPAKDRPSMRAKWHALFAQPRMRELLASTASYWMKDDHDHRYNDSDRESDRAPSNALGIELFREQAPIVFPKDPSRPTWRRIRFSQHLEVWMTEGRDHRSPNATPDGPDKTLWGAEQRAWLQRTLLASDATFRVLVSPTPLVGPDDGYKRDNHTNPKGFLHEGRAFQQWAQDQGLTKNGFFVVCGDRHWKYHSESPFGLQEFACGALPQSNSRRGRRPGDPKSTDPEAQVQLHWTDPKPSGGFLSFEVVALADGASLKLRFHQESGAVLHEWDQEREAQR